MARYIDAESLEKAIDDAQKDLKNRSKGSDDAWEINKPYFKGLAWARALLNEQPTADVEEVVRCKDCIFYEPHGNGKVGICRHLKLKSYLKHNIDFCSYGQRK